MGLMPLLWRIFLGNAAVLGVATLALVLSPATVSFPLAAREAVVLAAGLAVMLAINYALLRRAFGPLRRLALVMEEVDPLVPGRRSELPDATAEVGQLARAFDEMLERLEVERRESARRALAAQEDERRRVARELHDEVGQSLTAVILQLQQARSGALADAGERIAEAQDAARGTLEEVRAIARNLRPEALDELGLSAALRQLCLDAERTGIAVERRIGVDSVLEPEVEVVIYRVAQEALTNALRHAGAASIRLTFEASGGSGAILNVADDGCGPGGRPGSGTRGMRERAVLVGGTLDIQAAPGGGTVVTLNLP
jgi:two-component system, NarL family, sensor histidine kinase UhpB